MLSVYSIEPKRQSTGSDVRTRVYLHLGMPKCASTSVQAHFYRRYQHYRRQRLLYPRTCCQTKGYRSHRPLLDAPQDNLPDLIRQIAAEAAENGCNNILISSEEFINSRWDRAGSATVVDELNRQFGTENVTLIYLLREHQSFAESTYAQFIKGGMFRINERQLFRQSDIGLGGYADLFRETHGFEFFCYSEFFRRFSGGQAGNATEFISIHSEDLDGRDIVTALCERIGVRQKPEVGSRNARMSEEALFHILHARKRHGLAKVRPRRDILAKVFERDPSFASPLFRLSSDLLQRIRATATRDGAYLAQHSANRFDRLLSTADRQMGNLSGPVEPSENALATIDRIVTAEEITLDDALQLPV